MTARELEVGKLFQILAKMTTEQLTEFLNHPEVRSIVGYEATEAIKSVLGIVG